MSDAVIVVFVFAPTAVVDTIKLAAVAPAGTISPVKGRITLGLFTERPIRRPPAGAGPVSVTVPIEYPPPTTDVGAIAKLCKVAGTIATSAVSLSWPRLAVIVTSVSSATAEVIMPNVAEVAPPGTLIADGRTALALLDDRETISPPAGAGPSKVTVPEASNPPASELGETVSPVRLGAWTFRAALTVWDPEVA